MAAVRTQMSVFWIHVGTVFLFVALSLAVQDSCEEEEACAIGIRALPMMMPLRVCRCPNNNACKAPAADMVKVSQFDLQFCDNRNSLPECAVGQLASHHHGRRLSVHCECKTPMKMISRNDDLWDPDSNERNYYCEEGRKLCSGDEVTPCGLRERALDSSGRVQSNLRTLCDCPDKNECRMSRRPIFVGDRSVELGFCAA